MTERSIIEQGFTRIALVADSPFVNFSLQIPKEEYKAISDYVYWRGIFKEPVSRAGFMLQTVLDAVRRDREYREFKKKNAPEG